jgi:hypothetical protein
MLSQLPPLVEQALANKKRQFAYGQKIETGAMTGAYSRVSPPRVTIEILYCHQRGRMPQVDILTIRGVNST